MDKAFLALQVVEKIKPFLVGHPPEVQSAILAELLALWLAGHRPDVREVALTMHLGIVRDLTKVAARELWGS